MVKHIVLWNFKEELPQDEKKAAAIRIKEDLESLKGQIDGLVTIKVFNEALTSSNRDIALICELESKQALEEYQSHPKHLAMVAFIRSVTCDRICFDY